MTRIEALDLLTLVKSNMKMYPLTDSSFFTRLLDLDEDTVSDILTDKNKEEQLWKLKIAVDGYSLDTDSRNELVSLLSTVDFNEQTSIYRIVKKLDKEIMESKELFLKSLSGIKRMLENMDKQKILYGIKTINNVNILTSDNYSKILDLVLEAKSEKLAKSIYAVASNKMVLSKDDSLEIIEQVAMQSDDEIANSVSVVASNNKVLEREDYLDIIKTVGSLKHKWQAVFMQTVATNEKVLNSNEYLKIIDMGKRTTDPCKAYYARQVITMDKVLDNSNALDWLALILNTDDEKLTINMITIIKNEVSKDNASEDLTATKLINMAKEGIRLKNEPLQKNLADVCACVGLDSLVQIITSVQDNCIHSKTKVLTNKCN